MFCVCVCVHVSQSHGGEKMGRVSQLMRMYEFVPKMYHDSDSSSSDVGLAEGPGAGEDRLQASKDRRAIMSEQWAERQVVSSLCSS